MTEHSSEAAAAAMVGDRDWLGNLHDELRGLLGPVFGQARSRMAAFAYLEALLAEPGDRKSCWQLAQAAGDATPRRLQALLGEHVWDYRTALKALQSFILAHFECGHLNWPRLGGSSSRILAPLPGW